MKLGIVWNGIARMYKKHKWFSFLFIVQCFVCTLLVNMIFGKIFKIHFSVNKFSKFIVNKSYYRVNDDQDDTIGLFSYMKNENGEYRKLKTFHECLKNEKDWRSLSLDKQMIDINSSDIPDKFLFQYEQGHPIENDNSSLKALK